LIIYIDHLRSREAKAIREESQILNDSQRNSDSDYVLPHVHRDRAHQVSITRAASAIPRGRSQDQRIDSVLCIAEQFLEGSSRAHSQWQLNRDNPLPETKRQPKKARNAMRLQEQKNTAEGLRQKRLSELRDQVNINLSR
jgi:hypothetical protein